MPTKAIRVAVRMTAQGANSWVMMLMKVFISIVLGEYFGLLLVAHRRFGLRQGLSSLDWNPRV